MTEADIKKLQSTGGENLAATEKNILGNHLPSLWNLVSDPNFGGEGKKGGRIDFGRCSTFRKNCEENLSKLSCSSRQRWIRTVLRLCLR